VKNDLAKGAMWLTGARVIANILAFFSTLLLARLLVPADFGLVALATTILALISAITDLSLANALIHHPDPKEDHFHNVWTLNFLRDSAVGLLLAGVSPWVAAAYDEPRLVEVMVVLGIGVALKGLSNPKPILLTRKLIFWQEFVSIVAQKFAGLIASATIAIIYQTYWALVAGAIASQIVGTIISYCIMPYRPRFKINHARELWSFSIWLTLGQIVNTFSLKFDQLLIGGYLGRSTLGYYTVGDNLAVLPTREATSPLAQTLFPGLRKLVDDPVRLRHGYKLAQSFITALALPIGIGFALIAHPVVLVAMGEKWLPAVQVIQVLACIFALETIGTAVQPLAMAKGQTKMLFHRDVWILLVRVPIIVAGMYLGGLIGIVYARAIAGIIGIAINMRLVDRLITLSWLEQLKANARSLASVALMSCAVIGLEMLMGRDGERLELILKSATFIVAGAVVYVISHIGLWIAAGRPAGPESEVMKMVAKLRDVIRKRSAAKNSTTAR
jgi:O-antigen/teichoic acid export membrane protein